MKGFTIHTIRKSIQSLPSALKVFSIRWIRKDNLTVKLLVQLLLPALMWYFQEVSPDFLTEFVPSDFSLWEFNQIIQSLSVYPTSQNQNSHWSAFHLPDQTKKLHHQRRTSQLMSAEVTATVYETVLWSLLFCINLIYIHKQIALVHNFRSLNFYCTPCWMPHLCHPMKKTSESVTRG